MSQVINGKQFFSTRDVVDRTGVSRQTLWRWRREGCIPCGHRHRGRQVVFTAEEVESIRDYANRLEPALPPTPMASSAK